MYLSSVPIILFALLSHLVNAAPTSILSVAVPASTTYPSMINDTRQHHDAFFLTVASSNPRIGGHNIQLRPQPNSNATIAVIDATSPVLAARMNQGALQSMFNGGFLPTYPLGPQAHLGPAVHIDANSTKQSLVFHNGSGPAVHQWLLTNVSPDGQYFLYHHEPYFVSNGFVACEQTNTDADVSSGVEEKFYQLFYLASHGDQGPLPGCDYIAVQTFVGPVEPF